jgi:hypothetical protein
LHQLLKVFHEFLQGWLPDTIRGSQTENWSKVISFRWRFSKTDSRKYWGKCNRLVGGAVYFRHPALTLIPPGSRIDLLSVTQGRSRETPSRQDHAYCAL